MNDTEALVELHEALKSAENNGFGATGVTTEAIRYSLRAIEDRAEVMKTIPKGLHHFNSNDVDIYDAARRHMQGEE